MADLVEKVYIVTVQCHIVKERCPGYLCEKAWHERTGGYGDYPRGRFYRTLTLTCGGCCGRALHRKLGQFLRTLKKKEGIEKERVIVQFSSCISNNNYHAPPCPHLDYLRTLVARHGLDLQEGTVISDLSQKRRQDGTY